MICHKTTPQSKGVEVSYGPQPFDRVMRCEFSVEGIKDLKEAAYLQYELMLLKPVLRANVSFANKSAVVYYVGPPKETERKIVNALKPAKASLVSKSEMAYVDILKGGYHW